jgi:hypothetical protein
MSRPSLVAIALLVACKEQPPLYPANAPPDIAEACTLAQRKCTACHDRDRIVYARMTAEEWRETVDKMRRLPGSSISPAEGETILRCLLYRMNTPAMLATSCTSVSLR